MCYSATASFTASALLLSTGAYAVFKAHRHAPKYWLLALVPFIFSIQQAFEGSVWLDIHSKTLSLFYLFFAYFLWPGYIPLSLYPIEQHAKTRSRLIYLSLFGALVGASLYVPILFKWVHLDIYPMAHSLCYELELPNFYIYTLAFLYLLSIVWATFICSDKRFRIFGMLLTTAYIISYLFFRYAFTSVWCFLGALLSLFLVYLIPNSSKS